MVKPSLLHRIFHRRPDLAPQAAEDPQVAPNVDELEEAVVSANAQIAAHQQQIADLTGRLATAETALTAAQSAATEFQAQVAAAASAQARDIIAAQGLPPAALPAADHVSAPDGDPIAALRAQLATETDSVKAGDLVVKIQALQKGLRSRSSN